MKLKNTPIPTTSLFLVGTAVIIFLLNWLVSFVSRPILAGDAPGLHIGSYSLNWLLLIPAYMSRLADVLLAAAIGVLFRILFPNPSRSIRISLWVLLGISVVLFVFGSIYHPILSSGRAVSWPFYECAFISCAVVGYLYEEEKVDKHRVTEPLATVILVGIMF